MSEPTVKVTVELTAEEAAHVARMAKLLGMSVAEYLRRRIFLGRSL